jgi:hypothetical protein
MATAKNAKIEIETGQSLSGAYAVMTDSGDRQIFTVSGGTLWSGKSGYTPDIRPNGIVSGRNLVSTHASDDYVTVAAFTAYSKGTLRSVNAGSLEVTRASSGGYYKVNSVTMASNGSLAVVAGTEGAALATTRATAGGPPLIPVNSVELAQVITSSSTSDAIASTEIFQVVGQHTERYDYPTWQEFNVGLGESASSSAEKYAHVKFDAVLPAIHTGAVAKKTFIRYYAPQFTELTRTMAFRPVEQTHTVSSQEYYRGSIGSVSSSIGQGGFTALLTDGLTDSIVAEKDNVLTVRFYPDENKSAYSLTQGKIGLSRTFPYDNQVQAEVTISAERVTAEYAS